MTLLVIAVVRRANLNSIPFLLALVMSPNIGSAMTLIGNPQNMIIAVHSGLSFSKYFVYTLPLVVLSLVIVYIFIYFAFFKDMRSYEFTKDFPIYRIPQPYIKILYRLGILFVVFVSLLFLPVEECLNIDRKTKLPLIAITVGAILL